MSIKLQMLNDQFVLSPEDIANFRKSGFLKLKSFFTVGFIHSLLDKVSRQIS